MIPSLSPLSHSTLLSSTCSQSCFIITLTLLLSRELLQILSPDNSASRPDRISLRSRSDPYIQSAVHQQCAVQMKIIRHNRSLLLQTPDQSGAEFQILHVVSDCSSFRIRSSAIPRLFRYSAIANASVTASSFPLTSLMIVTASGCSVKYSYARSSLCFKDFVILLPLSFPDHHKPLPPKSHMLSLQCIRSEILSMRKAPIRQASIRRSQYAHSPETSDMQKTN